MRIQQSQIVAVLMAGRASEMSTELCLTLEGVKEPELALEIWGGEPTRQHFIGYLLIKPCNVSNEYGVIAGN